MINIIAHKVYGKHDKTKSVHMQNELQWNEDMPIYMPFIIRFIDLISSSCVLKLYIVLCTVTCCTIVLKKQHLGPMSTSFNKKTHLTLDACVDRSGYLVGWFLRHIAPPQLGFPRSSLFQEKRQLLAFRGFGNLHHEPRKSLPPHWIRQPEINVKSWCKSLHGIRTTSSSSRLQWRVPH